MDIQQLTDLYEIELTKARFHRYVDTVQLEALRELLTDDFEIVIEDPFVPGSTTFRYAGADAFLTHVGAGDPNRATVHQSYNPEIEFIDRDTAKGVWATYNSADYPERKLVSQIEGHNHELYRRGADGRWRIASIRIVPLRRQAMKSLLPRSGYGLADVPVNSSG